MAPVTWIPPFYTEGVTNPLNGGQVRFSPYFSGITCPLPKGTEKIRI